MDYDIWTRVSVALGGGREFVEREAVALAAFHKAKLDVANAGLGEQADALAHVWARYEAIRAARNAAWLADFP